MFDPKFIVKKTFTAERINRALSGASFYHFDRREKSFPFRYGKAPEETKRGKFLAGARNDNHVVVAMW
jgi:hypothetical protein